MSEVKIVKKEPTRLQKSVFSGNFPKDAVSKMNRKRLEKFVLGLVESTSEVSVTEAQDFEGLCRRLFLKEVDKPQWWPSDQIIFRTLTPDGKYLMELLKFLVYKCCEYFKKPSEDLNSEVFVTEIDENLKQLKRKHVALSSPNVCDDTDSDSDSDSSTSIPIKRRTLLPQNISLHSDEPKELILDEVKSPVVELADVFFKTKPLDQDHFLNLFELQSISCHTVENDPVLPLTSNSSIKFNMCTHIPFSSDLGLELMKRDNHNCPEITKSRKLDRLEWYLNKPTTKPNISYPVTYQEKKDITFRIYKFPRRQYYQQPGNGNYHLEDLHRHYLNVLLTPCNLEEMQKTLRNKSRAKLQVILFRLNETRSRSMGQIGNKFLRRSRQRSY